MSASIKSQPPSRSELDGGRVAPHAPLTEFYPSPEARSRFVGALFDETAHSYDLVSRLLTFGSERHYRRTALSRSGVKPGMKLLDVATGTGLVLQAALELGLPVSDLVGLDPSRGMLNENCRKHSVALVRGVGERLPFPDASFDFVTMGYALRHVEDLHVFFCELRRVLKPGGRVLLLEISKPPSRLISMCLRVHLVNVVPLLVRMVTGRTETAKLLRYYWATIERCVPAATILAALTAAGFKEACHNTRFGMLNDYLAVAG